MYVYIMCVYYEYISYTYISGLSKSTHKSLLIIWMVCQWLNYKTYEKTKNLHVYYINIKVDVQLSQGNFHEFIRFCLEKIRLRRQSSENHLNFSIFKSLKVFYCFQFIYLSSNKNK